MDLTECTRPSDDQDTSSDDRAPDVAPVIFVAGPQPFPGVRYEANLDLYALRLLVAQREQVTALLGEGWD